MPLTNPSPDWSVLDFLTSIFIPSGTKSKSSIKRETSSERLKPPAKPSKIRDLFFNFLNSLMLSWLIASIINFKSLINIGFLSCWLINISTIEMNLNTLFTTL